MKDEDTAYVMAVEALQALRRQILDLQRGLAAKPGPLPAAWDSTPSKFASLLDGIVDTLSAAAEAIVQESEQRRLVEEALRECEKGYQHLLDSVTDYVYTVKVENGQPVATVHGPNCVAVTGYTSQEYEAAPLLWFQMVHEKDRQAVIERANRLLTGETVPPFEHRITHKDGSVRWVKNTSILRRDEQGRLVAYDGLITDITARKQLEERLDAIYQLGRELTLLRDEAAIIERALETASSGLQIEGVGYGLVDESTGELESYYNLFHSPPRAITETYQTNRPGDLRYPHSLPPGQSVEFYLPLAGCQVCNISVSVIRSGQAITVDDITRNVRYAPQHGGWPKRSVLAVPMHVGQRIIGLLSAASADPNHFTPHDRQLLQTLADQTAVALENARLFKAEQTTREQAQILGEATAALASLDPNQVLDSILTCLERVVPYDNACVFLWEGEDLRAVAGRGSLIQEQVVGQRYPLDNSLQQGQMERTDHSLMLVNAILGLSSSDYIPGWISVPLMVRGEIIGYLTLDSRRATAYGHQDVALAQAFANQAAVAIQNARLFEQVRAGREQLQSLSHRLVEAQEIERLHIARELHDEAGQALTSLMVGLRLLEREADSPSAVLSRTTELKRMTDSVLGNLHRLAIKLRPASLDHLGLVAALQQHIETFNRQHGQSTLAQFKAVGFDDQRLPPAVETTLYRVVQEALTNVAKHAQATHLDVLMKRRGDRVVIVIEDDGVGFDVETARKNHHLGLVGMQERAEMLGGCLAVESTAGSGTTIFVEVPYAHSDPHRR